MIDLYTTLQYDGHISVKITYNKFHETMSSGNPVVPCREAGRQTGRDQQSLFAIF
jgi:hypothetical protein